MASYQTRIDQIARAAYGTWQYNGHDVLASLGHVASNLAGTDLGEHAAVEHTNAVVSQLTFESYRIQFEEWSKAESFATGVRTCVVRRPRVGEDLRIAVAEILGVDPAELEPKHF